MEKILKSKTVAWGLTITFLLSITPVVLIAEEVSTGNMIGYVYKKDGKTPIKGAVVKIRNIATGEEFSSEPTDDSGTYEINNVPEGVYHVKIYLDNKHQYNQRGMPEIIKDQTMIASFIIKGKTSFIGACLICPATYLLALAAVLLAIR